MIMFFKCHDITVLSNINYKDFLTVYQEIVLINTNLCLDDIWTTWIQQNRKKYLNQQKL